MLGQSSAFATCMCSGSAVVAPVWWQPSNVDASCMCGIATHRCQYIAVPAGVGTVTGIAAVQALAVFHGVVLHAAAHFTSAELPQANTCWSMACSAPVCHLLGGHA
jgi:hypothetical protein